MRENRWSCPWQRTKSNLGRNVAGLDVRPLCKPRAHDPSSEWMLKRRGRATCDVYCPGTQLNDWRQQCWGYSKGRRCQDSHRGWITDRG